MKVALCLSGNLRNFKDTYYSFQHYLLSNYDVDVFFYGSENKEGLEKNNIDLYELFKPKKQVINTQEFYENISFPIPPSFPLYAFYNIKKCNDLKCDYEEKNNFKYDLVIRSRTDYFWFRYLKNEELELAKNNILIPKEWAFKSVNSYARSDVFAIGSSYLMDKYSSIFEKVEEYVRSIGKFHPESICGYHLMTNNIPNIENERCVVFEYPSKRTEKYIYPHKHIKYFDEPDTYDEGLFIKEVSDKRKSF